MNISTTFFLVDDDSDDSYLFEEVTKEVEPPVQFLSASNGWEALNVLKSPNGYLPDVIFLDLNMPRMDGKECLAELKKDETLKNIPVIIYTTSSQSKDIEETIQKGAVGFITKPTNIKDLKSILAAIARSSGGSLQKTLVSLGNSTNTFIVC